MEIRILRLFHWNVVSWPGFFKKNRTGKEKVTAEEWKRAVITVMIGEHECHYSPCCCRMKGFHTDRRLLQCSVQDDCYCAVLRDPPQNPNPPSAVTQGHFIQWDDSEMLSLALFLFAVKWGLCFLPQGFLFFWCHMLNLVHHCKSLRFTLHVRGEERCSHFKAPSSFICSSMIPSLLSGDGWQDAQSLPEMGSFHHSHMPQSWSPLRWRGCVNGFLSENGCFFSTITKCQWPFSQRLLKVCSGARRCLTVCSASVCGVTDNFVVDHSSCVKACPSNKMEVGGEQNQDVHPLHGYLPKRWYTQHQTHPNAHQSSPKCHVMMTIDPLFLMSSFWT